jgi:SynChlorMet cassette radical SAM/SPASM protein ScmE
MTMKLMKTPRSVDLSITNRCNLRCTYCSHFTGAGDVGQDLPKEEWLQFFEELNRCAVMTVTIGGGEPFCRKDLPELIEGIVRNRMRFTILSNGTMITDEKAAFLASTGRCNGVQVSIDGSIPTTHDACRGEGNFIRAMQGIKSLQKYNVPVLVRVTIHKHNVEDLENVARLLLQEVGLPSFSTYCDSPRNTTDASALQQVLWLRVETGSRWKRPFERSKNPLMAGAILAAVMVQ